MNDGLSLLSDGVVLNPLIVRSNGSIVSGPAWTGNNTESIYDL